MEKTLKIISLDKVRSLDPSLPIYILSPIFTTGIDVKYCLKILSQHLDIVNQFLTICGNHVRERLLRELDLLIKNVVGIVKRKYRSIIRFFKVKIPPMTLEYDSHDCKILIDPSKETADVIIKNSARTVFLFPINGREISFCAEKYFQAILPLSYRVIREVYRRKMVKFINIHKSFALIDTFHVCEFFLSKGVLFRYD